MNIEKMIEEKIVKDLDLSHYKEQIDKAVKDYFSSGYFAESLSDALADQDIAAEIAVSVSKKLISSIKSKVTVSIG